MAKGLCKIGRVERGLKDMYKLVDWNAGMERTGILDLFRAEYERCNIWPDYGSEDGYKIEAENAANTAFEYAENLCEEARSEHFPNDHTVEFLRANAIETACMALKVVSVCDKWLNGKR